MNILVGGDVLFFTRGQKIVSLYLVILQNITVTARDAQGGYFYIVL